MSARPWCRRLQVADTLAEIQERHDAVKELERSLLDLHQIFLDMAVLVEAQGEMLDNIGAQARAATPWQGADTGFLPVHLVFARRRARTYGFVCANPVQCPQTWPKGRARLCCCTGSLPVARAAICRPYR